MADGLPPISLEVANSGSPYVIVGEAQASDYDALMALAPALLEPDWIRVRAQLINHISNGYEYAVILDPEEFKEKYLAEFEAEDADTPAAPGQRRLRAFGKPDFDQIEPPKMDGDSLVFFAVDSYLGIPYRAVSDGAGTELTYTPMVMN